MKINDLVDALERRIGPTGRPARLINTIEFILVDEFNYPGVAAVEKAERWSEPVARAILERGVACETEGHVPALVLLGAAAEMVAGACFVLPTDTEIEAKAKRQRIHLSPMLDAIRNLTFLEFEKFASRVLDELGAINSVVTPQRGDQGIDFHGQISIGNLQNMPIGYFRFAHETVLYLAGQAKHYPNRRIGPDVVRELIGSITLARTKTFSDANVDLFGSTKLRPFSPLLALLFSTGEFSGGASYLAAEAGIIMKSGVQLATFLTDRGVAMRADPGGPTFDLDLFRTWLGQ